MRRPTGPGARKMLVQPGSFQKDEVPMVPTTPKRSKIPLEALLKAHCRSVTRMVPDKQLPNIRIVVETIGAHMVMRLTGRKMKIGST